MTERTRRAVVFALFPLLAGAAGAGAQETSREWITESTATVGRPGDFGFDASFLARVLLIADGGIRWVRPSGRGLGVSLAGGYDAPNEAVLAGVRARASLDREWGRVEGSLAVLASSAGPGGVGGLLGLAWYPVPWGAIVAQAAALPWIESNEGPGAPNDPEFDPEASLNHEPSASVGLRLAERPGLAGWIVAGVLGLLGATISFSM